MERSHTKIQIKYFLQNFYKNLNSKPFLSKCKLLKYAFRLRRKICSIKPSLLNFYFPIINLLFLCSLFNCKDRTFFLSIRLASKLSSSFGSSNGNCGQSIRKLSVFSSGVFLSIPVFRVSI